MKEMNRFKTKKKKKKEKEEKNLDVDYDILKSDFDEMENILY